MYYSNTEAHLLAKRENEATQRRGSLRRYRSLFFNAGPETDLYFGGDIHIDSIDRLYQREFDSGLYLLSTTVNGGYGTLINGVPIAINQRNRTVNPKGQEYGFFGASVHTSVFDNQLQEFLDFELNNSTAQ